MTEYIEPLYEKYLAECAAVGLRDAMSRDVFGESVAKKLADAGYVTVDDGVNGRGIMYYSLWQEDGCQVCAVPEFAYYAETERGLTALFCKLAEKVLPGGSTRFSVNLYAHDTEAQRAFSMMQFGYMSEKGLLCIRDSEVHSLEALTVRTLTKEQITENWDTVWGLTHGIVSHLQDAPVFYPGNEFTEDVYKEFYMDDGTSVHAVFDGDGRMIGMIETNPEPTWFCGESAKSANIGEAYVIPSYRGSGAAQALLGYAVEYVKKRGAEYLWVEHGTANPSGRGFWNKYFRTFRYEMVRTIEKEK